MKVAIIIPAHNEEKRIGRTLEAYSGYFDAIRKTEHLDYEILVVVNKTTDLTEEIVKKFGRNNPRVSYLTLKRGGKGYAVIEGFKEALKDKQNNLIGFVDADMATSPTQFHRLIREIGANNGAIASRNIQGSKLSSPLGFRRAIVGRTFNFIVRSILLIPYRDTQCGAKLFKRDALSRVLPHLVMTKWAFDVELLYTFNKMGFKVLEVPTIWSERRGSKLNVFSAGPWMLLGVIRLRLMHSPFKFFVKIYDKVLGGLIKI